MRRRRVRRRGRRRKGRSREWSREWRDGGGREEKDNDEGENYKGKGERK